MKNTESRDLANFFEAAKLLSKEFQLLEIAESKKEITHENGKARAIYRTKTLDVLDKLEYQAELNGNLKALGQQEERLLGA